MNGLQITKETYKELTTDQKLDVIFDISKHLCKQKKIDTAVSGVAGFMGGLIAVLGKSLWK